MSSSSSKPWFSWDVAFVSASPELIDNEIAMNRLRKVCNIVRYDTMKDTTLVVGKQVSSIVNVISREFLT